MVVDPPIAQQAGRHLIARLLPANYARPATARPTSAGGISSSFAVEGPFGDKGAAAGCAGARARSSSNNGLGAWSGTLGDPSADHVPTFLAGRSRTRASCAEELG